MLLIDVIDSVRYGELSMLSIGGEGQGVVSQKNYPQLATSINAGLTALYTRFFLKEGHAYLELVPEQTDYALRYADLGKLERAYTDKKFECSINDLNNPLSLMLQGQRALYVPPDIVNQDQNLPEQLKTAGLQLFYRALHPKIDTESSGYFDIEDIELELPSQFMEALGYYIASRHTTPLDMTGQFHAGNNYSAKFEQACKVLETVNVSVDRQANSDRLIRNGWV